MGSAGALGFKTPKGKAAFNKIGLSFSRGKRSLNGIGTALHPTYAFDVHDLIRCNVSLLLHEISQHLHVF